MPGHMVDVLTALAHSLDPTVWLAIRATSFLILVLFVAVVVYTTGNRS